jgi:hypothetical protein
VRLLVYLRDGRTVYMIKGRAVLSQLVGAEPWGEHRGVNADRGTWNPTTGDYNWRTVRLRHLAKGSISHVEEARYGEETPAP